MTEQAKPGTLSIAVHQKHFPSLNGLRGISIILVLLDHLHLGTSKLCLALTNGALGVNIFFVLSGFLITTLCLKEKKLTGNLSLREFYIRRVLRIFPVAYLYLIVLFILDSIFHLDVANIQYLGAMLYVMDFSYFKTHSFSWFTTHYWSLSVEEQFYILFPFILKTKEKAFFYAVLFIIVALPLLCTLQEWLPSVNKGFLYGFTHFFIKFQSISVGCLLSFMAFKGHFDGKLFQSNKVLGNAIAFFLLFYLKYDPMYSLGAVYINLVISFITGYIILTNLSIANNIFYKALNFKPLSFVGILSYSIYIWQEIFTSGNLNLPKYLVMFPYNIVFIIIVPIISYYCFEKYFLRLKTKFSKLKN